MNLISDVKLKLRKATQEAMGAKAGMLSAPDQCEHMRFLIEISNSKFGIEVGTFTGYSALCMAEGLPSDGKLTCLDISDEYFNVGLPYLQEAN